MKLRHIYLIAAGAVLVMGMGACKPTEKNYRAAYDAAQAKRQAAVADDFIPAQGLQSTDGPRLTTVGETQIYTWSEPLKSDDVKLGICNIAVGLYSMDTNARSLAERLQSEGYSHAGVVTNGDGKFYVVAVVTTTLEEAAAAVAEFEKRHAGFPYSGLQGAPLVLLR
ncbi:MAG: SPOR domain-containing protein [Muribaculaceae bacterium]|nr:SPOR domain-containing protein [Muribaculaceae bacterium]